MLRFAVVALSLLVSGCAGAGSPRSTSALAAAPELGSIEGVVYDTEFQPLTGVRVSVSGVVLVATSNARGVFVLRGLEPGTYELRADLAGYRGFQADVDVMAGETTQLRVELEAIPTVVAYSELVVFKGHMSVGAATPLFALRPGVDLQDQLVFSRNATSGSRGLVLAMTWQPSFPLTSKKFQLDSILDSQLYNQTVGTNPLLNRIDALDPARTPALQHSIWLPRTCDYYTTATCIADPPDTLVALALDQRFDLYSTLFYGEPAPVAYTGLPA